MCAGVCLPKFFCLVCSSDDLPLSNCLLKRIRQLRHRPQSRKRCPVVLCYLRHNNLVCRTLSTGLCMALSPASLEVSGPFPNPPRQSARVWQTVGSCIKYGCLLNHAMILVIFKTSGADPCYAVSMALGQPPYVAVRCQGFRCHSTSALRFLFPVDVEELVSLGPGTTPIPVRDYLYESFGYKHNFIGWVALIMIGQAPSLGSNFEIQI